MQSLSSFLRCLGAIGIAGLIACVLTSSALADTASEQEWEQTLAADDTAEEPEVLEIGEDEADEDSHDKEDRDESSIEADEIMARIDARQTELNAANLGYARACAEYDAAVLALEEAQRRVDEETANLEQLQESLGECAGFLYKHGSEEDLVQLFLEPASHDEFLQTWEALQRISQKNADLVEEAEKARESLEQACTELEQRKEAAATQKELARTAHQEAVDRHEALMSESSRITAEIAALEAQVEALEGDAVAAEAQREAAEGKAREQLETRAKTAHLAADATRSAAERAQAEADERGIDTSSPISGTLLQNPCPEAWESSGFGYRSFDDSFHMGLDMAASADTPYFAAESGTVIYATNDGGYNGGAGNWVVIAHGNGLVTKYMHSNRTLVQPGDEVVRGQHIGDVGETGQAFGAHLHFQVELDGTPVNPLEFI